MDAKQFDDLVARLSEGPSRRDALKGAIGGALASIGIGAAAGDDADAKGKGKGKGGGGHGRGHGGGGHGKGHGGGGHGKGHDDGGVGDEKKKHKHKKKKCKHGKKHCGSKKKCFDLQTSNSNCGSCKFACLSTEQCVAGVCQPLT